MYHLYSVDENLRLGAITYLPRGTWTVNSGAWASDTCLSLLALLGASLNHCLPQQPERLVCLSSGSL